MTDKCTEKSMTLGDHLRNAAEAQGIPLRTLEQVKTGLARAKKNGADVSLARLMLRAGRLTDEARDYVREHYAP